MTVYINEDERSSFDLELEGNIDSRGPVDISDELFTRWKAARAEEMAVWDQINVIHGSLPARKLKS